MNLSYSLNEEDYLINQLYTASHSENVKKKRFITWITVMAAYLFVGILLYQAEDRFAFNFFAILAVITSAFFPFYLRGFYKRQFRKSIIENYQNKFGSTLHVSFTDSKIEVKTGSSIIKTQSSSIKKIIEISSHFFVKMENNETLIIPKGQLSNAVEVGRYLIELAESLHIQYMQEEDWKWR